MIGHVNPMSASGTKQTFIVGGELAFDLEADCLHWVCNSSLPEAFGYSKLAERVGFEPRCG